MNKGKSGLKVGRNLLAVRIMWRKSYANCCWYFLNVFCQIMKNVRITLYLKLNWLIWRSSFLKKHFKSCTDTGTGYIFLFFFIAFYFQLEFFLLFWWVIVLFLLSKYNQVNAKQEINFLTLLLRQPTQHYFFILLKLLNFSCYLRKYCERRWENCF